MSRQQLMRSGRDGRPATHVGILLYERRSGNQVGLVEFHPSGVLAFRVLQPGLHYFALKPIERRLSDTVLRHPLYIKYAQAIRQEGSLERSILKREARLCAAALNRSRPTLQVGNTRVSAYMVQYRD